MTNFISLKTSLPGPRSQELLQLRHKHVPKGPFNTSKAFIAHAEGACITDVDGNHLLDFAGGIGTLNAGHCPPTVVQALTEQIQHYIHPSFHVMMYEPYINLAKKLNEITPGALPKKTFFLNSGAEAVENAVKIARKFTGKKAVLSFERGFHGRTYMAMSLTSKVRPYKYEFGPFAPETYKLPFPYYYRAQPELTEQEIDQLAIDHIKNFFLSEVPADEVAAIIFEPVQGEGGFIHASNRFVTALREICDENDILLIADEIQTGFGRTGKMFAMEHYDVVPDLMTLSKSIAAGVPISAVTGKAEVMDAANVGEIGGTYGGSPLGCVAALEVIKMMEEQRLPDRAKEIGRIIVARFKEMQQQIPQIGDIRCVGAMCAIELVQDRKTKEPAKTLTTNVIAAANQKGLIIMGAGLYSNVIRILSPLVITNSQLEEGLTVLQETIIEQTAN